MQLTNFIGIFNGKFNHVTGVYKMRITTIITGLLLSIFASSASANDFEISFDWGDIKKCITGNPNTVPNPIFELKNVPDETAWIYFKMVDRNVPSYDHGGGWVEYKGQSKINPGAFKYYSPCPPNGRHKYEWTATAKKKKSSSGGTISKAKASKMYP